MIEVRQIDVEETYPLRQEVLRKGMTLSCKMGGDYEKGTFHLGVFEDGHLVCIASFMVNSHPGFEGSHYQLRGMATADHKRGKGYGKMILEEALKELKKRGTSLLWCNAREVALDFYRKLGFQILGEAFEVDQVGTHFVMCKSLSDTKG